MECSENMWIMIILKVIEKPGLQPLSRGYTFGKTTQGVKLTHPTSLLKVKSYAILKNSVAIE